jgi:hypothetical protein
MKQFTTLAVGIGSSLCLGLLAQADEIQFTTLPPPVQTTVIRETHITSPSSVRRVIRQDGGVYAVTVHSETGDQIVYVNDALGKERPERDLPRSPDRAEGNGQAGEGLG